MHVSPVLAEKAHSRPVALKLLCWSSQGLTGGSHGGGGLLDVGGAIQGGSTLEVLLLLTLVTER